jgi:hypothetical protein
MIHDSERDSIESSFRVSPSRSGISMALIVSDPDASKSTVRGLARSMLCVKLATGSSVGLRQDDMATINPKRIGTLFLESESLKWSCTRTPFFHRQERRDGLLPCSPRLAYRTVSQHNVPVDSADARRSL